MPGLAHISLLVVVEARRGGRGYERERDYTVRLEPGLEFFEAYFTILPLQRTEGHMQAIRNVGICRHKQYLVICAYMHINESICACVCVFMHVLVRVFPKAHLDYQIKRS